MGMHLLMDGYDCPPAPLSSSRKVRQLLETLPRQLGMKAISRAKVMEYRAEKAADSGVTGIIMLAESHITVHTFPQRGYVAVDIFSCKPFPAKSVSAQLKKEFSMGKADVRIIGRRLGSWQRGG